MTNNLKFYNNKLKKRQIYIKIYKMILYKMKYKSKIIKNR